MSHGQILPIKIIERILPGRINTKAIANWEGEHGVLCSGCRNVVNHIFASCDCPEWQEANTRMMKNVKKIIQS